MTSNSAEQKTVLVVDDDATLRELIRIGFNKLDDIRCILASNGMEGLEKIRNNRVDLLITDLQMPGMDGITFLSHIMEEFPHIPRVVMTAMGKKPQEYVEQTGVIAVIPKPVDINILVENAGRWISSYRPHTYTEGVDLSSLMQLIALDRKTCTVGVQDKKNGRIGLIHIYDGEMADAAAGNMTGIDAAMNILLWSDVRIWIHDLVKPAAIKIDTPMQAILMNAALAKDEGSGNAEPEKTDIPTARWIRENRPPEVNIEATSTAQGPQLTTKVLSEEETALPENNRETAPGPAQYLSRENRFLEEVTETLKKNQVAASELDSLFDEAISAFRTKDYERSKTVWMKALEVAPDHPVIKQNLKILGKYLP